MTPREFLSYYSYDQRLVTGEFFSQQPLQVEEGECIGVVLLNLGGPERLEDIQPFLYNLFMDPAIIDIPLPGILRHWLCKFISWRRAKAKEEEYEAIGGGSPINRLTEEQSTHLENQLNEAVPSSAGITFRTYIAMRYWHPFSEEAAERMVEDDVDRVVLLPLYPQYSKTTTGASLVYWNALEETREIPKWPTTFVKEYATHPGYLNALSDRIDEGLKNFNESVRKDVHLLFSAHGTPLKEMTEREDPYCCLIHSTVDRLMKKRNTDRPFHTAFQSKVGPGKWLAPSTPEKLEELAADGVSAVLVVPVAFVTDHVETSFELDIEIREEAEEMGIEQFEVMDGLNSHPDFIQALVEATFRQIEWPENFQKGEQAVRTKYSENLDVPLHELDRYSEEARDVRCIQCEHVTESYCWDTDRNIETNRRSR